VQTVPAPKPHEDGYFLCQCCGAELPLTATSCRYCGASDESGWGEDYQREDLDVPARYGEEDDDFDYDDFVAREFPDQATGGGDPTASRFQVVVVLLICIGLLASVVLYVFQ
jgi:hypothetical protein